MPLRGSLAVAAGLVTKGRLRGTGFRRLFPDIYLPTHLTPTLTMRSRGAYLLVVGRGALAGYSAAELLGARIAPRDAEAEVVTRADEYSVLATPNLNGDYISDACAAQIGGLVVNSTLPSSV